MGVNGRKDPNPFLVAMVDRSFFSVGHVVQVVDFVFFVVCFNLFLLLFV